MKTPWIIMPVVDGWDYTQDALNDCLALRGSPRILAINQGSSDATRAALERYAEKHPAVEVWSHQPPLPALGATWNAGLDFAWMAGSDAALVVNNDVRLHTAMLDRLLAVLAATGAWFISGVGVTAQDFHTWTTAGAPFTFVHDAVPGGPDFSCFLFTKIGHAAYRFDERFQPAYFEDLDLHRRMMLAGDGRKIFGVNLPFLHLSSKTIQQPAHEARIRRGYEQSKVRYTQKWGGDANQETYARPDDDASVTAGLTTPELQRAVWSVPDAGRQEG